MRDIVLIAHDIRSTHNIGSLLRTAEGFGVSHVYITGYSPYPAEEDDERMPHIRRKLDAQIHKTALGAEEQVDWTHVEDAEPVLQKLKADGYTILALEQTPDSVSLPLYRPPDKSALLIGREVEGIDTELLKQVDLTLEIPMYGKKESFNVAQATAVALYALREA